MSSGCLHLCDEALSILFLIIQIFVESLLCSGSLKNISFAGRMLERGSIATQLPSASALNKKEGTPDQDADLDTVCAQSKVPLERAVELVISAAREYFDASTAMDDPDMELSR